MPLQTENLVMVGLGSSGNEPPSLLQPRLADGIHLRWAFKQELGFPWHGFYLYRRLHRQVSPSVGTDTRDLSLGLRSSNTLNLSFGQITSDENIRLTDDFPAPGFAEFDLANRRFLRFTWPSAQPARFATVAIGFRQNTSVNVTALWGETPVVQTRLSGQAGSSAGVILEFDRITAVEIGPGAAALLSVFLVPALQDVFTGWELVPAFPYPLCLPVAHPDYPCINAPATIESAEALALSRVLYGAAENWAGQAFENLHDQLLRIVEGGPSSTPMVDRLNESVLGIPLPPDPGVEPPQLSPPSPLNTVLLGSLHPAIAQMLGLYWVDRSAEPGVAYDYLVVADYDGFIRRPTDLINTPTAILTQLNGYIVFNKRRETATPLPAPTSPQVYALPGSSLRTRGGGLQDATNNAGLRWDLGLSEQGILLPNRSILYHVWRADLGQDEPTAAPTRRRYNPITVADEPTDVPPVERVPKPILITRPSDEEPERSPDWPPFPLFAIDSGLQDGWYSYQVSGVDIFGRHSPNSAPAVWRQWRPAPQPRPWYYNPLLGRNIVHPFAVRLLDKIPPPSPTAIEAYALDPADPTVLKDIAYNNWQETLSSTERQTLVGLRVLWRWTQAQMRQAPDTREFRIYYEPGTNPPNDYSAATNWQERYYVVGFDEHVTEEIDESGRLFRQYDVFLPAPGDTFRESLPLIPSLADPIVYANIGVSAADDKTHTEDNPKWLSGRWGGPERFGNEGPVGSPAKIFRVLREKPDPPVPPPDSERVFATPADYYAKSFYTYRWRPRENLKTHVFRALDESLFKVDWLQRHQPQSPRSPLTASQLQFFPDVAIESRWDQLKREQVANELNQLDNFSDDNEGKAEAIAYYRGLSNDALRILAGLVGNDVAFSQITIQPLDPDEPNNANRLGPDNPSNFPVDPTLRAYVDTLDGRSTNRYFYRAAYVDGANNRSELSLSSPPVWLPNVVPPRAPVVTKVLGGDRQIALRWASNRELDLAEYRIYRADNKQATRDLRLMTLVHIEPVQISPTARPAEVVWVDESMPGLITFYYRIVAVDEAGNSSEPSRNLVARAFDESMPVPPVPTVTWVEALNHLRAQITWFSEDTTLLQQRESDGAWIDLGQWREPGTYTIRDPFSDPSQTYEYRLWARKSTGAVIKGAAVTLAAIE